jgi:Fur family ferric uptake transcriptional regulator
VTEYTSKLKQAGLKVTLPRLKILEILSQGEGQHASAEDIYKILVSPQSIVFSLNASRLD